MIIYISINNKISIHISGKGHYDFNKKKVKAYSKPNEILETGLSQETLLKTLLLILSVWSKQS